MTYPCDNRWKEHYCINSPWLFHESTVIFALEVGDCYSIKMNKIKITSHPFHIWSLIEKCKPEITNTTNFCDSRNHTYLVYKECLIIKEKVKVMWHARLFNWFPIRGRGWGWTVVAKEWREPNHYLIWFYIHKYNEDVTGKSLCQMHELHWSPRYVRM